MKNFHKSTIDFLKAEHGWVSAWSIFIVLSLLAMGGLSVDYANGLQTRAKLQAASDAAALAASQDLPDTTKALEQGLAIADRHFGSREGNPIVASDFVFGNWDEDTGTIIVDEEPINAVRVIASRNEDKDNALPTFLLKLVGVETFDVVTGAIAVGLEAERQCLGGGFFTDSNLNSGSNNSYFNGFCLYGHNGVKISSDNTFETGTHIEMRNTRNFDQGGNNIGVDDALNERTYELELPDFTPVIIASMRDGSLEHLPDFITRVQSVDKLEPEGAGDLTEGTLYIVDDVADFSKVANVRNVAVVAEKEVKIGSNQTMFNVVFATEDKILIGSNNSFVHPQACDHGRYTAYFFSRSNIEFGSNNFLTGVQMAADDMIKLGSDVRGLRDVYGEARGDIEYGSADTFAGCPQGLESDIGTGPSKPASGPNATYSAFVLVR